MSVHRLSMLAGLAVAGALATWPAAGADRVVLQMRWDNQFQFAGIYAADWEGYYEDAGLDVEIRSAFGDDGSQRKGPVEVAEGRAHFGIGAAEVLTARDQGAPLVVVASIFQQSPVGIFARADANVSSPADLTRLTVLRSRYRVADVEMQAVLRNEGIDPEDATGPTREELTGSPFGHLASGRVDAYAGWRMTALWRAQEENVPITVLRPSAYGIDFYGDSLFTSKAYARSNPDVVRRFVEATLKGWQYALDNADAMAERIARELPRELPVRDLIGFNRFQAEEVRRLTLYPVVTLGHINPDRWRRMHEILKMGNLVTGVFDEDFIFDPEQLDARAREQAARLVVAVALGAAVIALAAVAWVLALRRTVARQTIDLRNEVDERRKSEEALHLYANVFWGTGAAMLISDRDNRIVNVNPAFTRLTGYALADVLGKDPSLLSAGLTPPEIHQDMWSNLDDRGYWQGELLSRSKGGRVYPNWSTISIIGDDAGEQRHFMACYTDISERKETEEHVRRLAHHDALTGLLNRFSMEDRLEQALLSARRDGTGVAVMFIDLDRFKTINDTHGHHVGDKLLQAVADRLTTCVRESDIVARQGGDEFVVALTGLQHPGLASTIASKIIETLSHPYRVDAHDLHSSPSIGISLFPSDGENVEGLMKIADNAMYYAKDMGRRNYQFFSASMMAAANERMEIERDLPGAVAEGQFELHYQPQVRAYDGRLSGFEALIRWNHPKHGRIEPDRFITIAEQIGVIEGIGKWVLDEACRKLAEWKSDGLDGVRMAINISRHQLRSDAFVEDVRAAMEKHGLKGSEIELEVTETVAMADAKQAITCLRRLKGLGVGLAIDDFGTGYSSLAYLKRFPIDVLKLDREFVRDIGHDENASAISAAAMALAHSMGLAVIAEGVETEAQRSFLTGRHCDHLQGYLFGRPMAATHWKRFLASNEEFATALANEHGTLRQAS